LKRRTVIFLSDRTGITAETLGLSLMSQFEGLKLTHVTLPFVDSIEKAHEATNQIQAAFEADGARPLVFATLLAPTIREIIENSNAYIIDLFKTFIPGLETELGIHSSNISGRIHGVGDSHSYNTRIEAVNFSLSYDDGARTSGYDTADLILLGVSRCGKTPTSLYLAMQFGLRTANYPIADEDLESHNLPKLLRPYRSKLFGLTIDPKRLHAIRSERRPNSQYATEAQCAQEVNTVEAMYLHEKIPYLSSTNLSIEELATKIMVISRINRKNR
jgi:[pyruvate, water dikinase]-phosphate phosphotransferase / [pyruvate, water dikinase] kinase